MSKCYDLKYKLFEGDLRKIQIKETRVLYMSHEAISKKRSLGTVVQFCLRKTTRTCTKSSDLMSRVLLTARTVTLFNF